MNWKLSINKFYFLIIDYNNKLYPIEIKKSKNPSRESIKNFNVLNDNEKKQMV